MDRGATGDERVRHGRTGRGTGWAVAAILAAIGCWQVGSAGGPTGGQAGPLWISETALDGGRRLLIVVDATTRHAAVYHVDAAAGTLALRSSRDITWDLMVGDFNAQDPKPAALRKMLAVPAAEQPR